MANIVLINNNNIPIVSVSENIMQRSKNAHIIRFYVYRNYYDWDMEDFMTTLEFVTPDGSYRTAKLELAEEQLKESEGYSLYEFELASEYTKFAGDFEFSLTFSYVDPDTGKSYIRKTQSCSLTIVGIDKWQDLLTDESLGVLDNALIQIGGIANAINAAAAIYNDTKADNIGIDESGTLHAMVNGRFIGEGVDVSLPLAPDTEDGEIDGVIDLDKIINI